MTILRNNKIKETKQNPFWNFSLALYQKPQNKAALLFLQNHYKLNVNLILAMLWHAASGKGNLSNSAVIHLVHSITPWQTLLTAEIRKLRQTLVKRESTLYKQVLDIEIYSEQIQQNLIYDFFLSHPFVYSTESQKSQQGIENLRIYFSLCECVLSEEAYQQIRYLLSYTFSAFKELDFPQLRFDL